MGATGGSFSSEGCRNTRDDARATEGHAITAANPGAHCEIRVGNQDCEDNINLVNLTRLLAARSANFSPQVEGQRTPAVHCQPGLLLLRSRAIRARVKSSRLWG